MGSHFNPAKQNSGCIHAQNQSHIHHLHPTMPTFLFHGTYVDQGIQGLLKEGGTAREVMIRKLIKSLGGTCECVYFGLDTDAYAIAQMPSESAAASFNLTCNASGKLKVAATLLLTPEQMDKATKAKPEYRPPGE